MTPALLGTYEQLHGEVLGLVQVDTGDAAMGTMDIGDSGGDGPAVRCTGRVADLGRHLGLARTDPRRRRAAALAAVTASHREGYEHLGHVELVAPTARLAGADRLIAADGCAAAVTDGLLEKERLGDVEVVATLDVLRAERELAADLHRLRHTDRSRRRPRLAELAPADLTPALRAVRACPVSVLAGSRGTGAADEVAPILRVAEAAGGRVGEDLVGVPCGADGDVCLTEEPTHGELVARGVRAVTRRIPEHLGVDLDGIQVLTPRRDGPVGVRAIETGLTEALGQADRAPLVRTIHRAAGRSWPVVVVVVDASDRGVVDRRMLYTAVTRAEQALIVVGQAETVRAVARWERPVARRTGLCARLRP